MKTLSRPEINQLDFYRKMKKLIIIDRDGVINEDSDFYIKSPNEWRPIPQSLDAIAKFKQAGYTVVIATNQSGIGRNFFSLETLKKIHRKMQNAVEKNGGKIDRIYFCPHKPEDNCNCRKPKAGMFEKIAKDYSIDLCQTFFIGDSLCDLQAAKNANCQFILVRTGKGEKTLAENPKLTKTLIVKNNLFSAAEYIL